MLNRYGLVIDLFFLSFFLLLGHTLKQFEDFFWKTPLGRYIAEAKQEMQVEFFHRYLQDFISLTTNLTTEVELQVSI